MNFCITNDGFCIQNNDLKQWFNTVWFYTIQTSQDAVQTSLMWSLVVRKYWILYSKREIVSQNDTNEEFCIQNDEFCIQNDEFCSMTRNSRLWVKHNMILIQTEESCTKTEELCIKNEDSCIKTEELCIKNEELCIHNEKV